ncbi:MAG: 4Fe-4S cluster-binding domain-containing protein, partial [Desulfobacterales bacterium]
MNSSRSVFPLAFKHFVRERNGVPGQLVIQITNHCNGRCPQCGMRVTETFKRTSLSVETIKKIIDHAAKNHVSALSFTGGEPFLLAEKVAVLIRYAGEKDIPFIRTGT